MATRRAAKPQRRPPRALLRGKDHGAAIPVVYLTAYHMLFRIARVRRGDRVLIHMAAGGVGIAALQLCRTIDGIDRKSVV